MAIFIVTMANHHYYATYRVPASSAQAAKDRIEADATITAYLLKCAAEERGMWLEEQGDYPGDDTYVYRVDGIERAFEHDDDAEEPIAGEIELSGAGCNG